MGSDINAKVNGLAKDSPELISLLGVGGSTAAGPGKESLWSALVSGDNLLQSLNIPGKCPGAKAMLWPDWGSQSQRERILSHLDIAMKDLSESLTDRGRAALEGNELGVIFASTKGAVEDFVWENTAWPEDSIAPVRTGFLEQQRLTPKRSVTVSNACASVHGALYLAQKWMRSGSVGHVLIVAFDGVGPFVWSGFQALGAIAKDRSTPFAADRDGLQLGEAAVVLLLSKDIESDVVVNGISIDSEGSAVTRPSITGASMKRTILAAQAECRVTTSPDVIVAHGTGTKLNDAIEDQIFTEVFGGDAKRPLVTSAKWCVGHTLGSSGAVDLMAASMMLKRQEAFRIQVTEQADPSFKANVLCGKGLPSPIKIDQILITSLGFGGANGAAILGRHQ
jgi:hypothetical protein